MLADRSCTDVKFLFSVGPPVEAHKVTLSAASSVFKNIFLGKTKNESYKDVFEDISWTCDAREKCVNLVHSEQECGNGKTVMTLNSCISRAVFLELLMFLYTGLPSITADEDKNFVNEIKNAAEKFQLSWLEQICENLLGEESFLNPSIGTWLNDNSGSASKSLFLNKPLMSDITFRIQDTVVHAHRAVLVARCDVMAAMLGGAFRESSSGEVRTTHISPISTDHIIPISTTYITPISTTYITPMSTTQHHTNINNPTSHQYQQPTSHQCQQPTSHQYQQTTSYQYQ